jgi:hypothetical protein
METKRENWKRTRKRSGQTGNGPETKISPAWKRMARKGRLSFPHPPKSIDQPELAQRTKPPSTK